MVIHVGIKDTTCREIILILCCFNGMLDLDLSARLAVLNRRVYAAVQAWRKTSPRFAIQLHNKQCNLDILLSQWTMNNIVKLELVDCAQLSDDSLICFAENNNKLRQVHIERCNSISNNLVHQILFYATELESIDIDRDILDVLLIMHSSPARTAKLKRLRIHSTVTKSAEAWAVILQYREELEYLCLKGMRICTYSCSLLRTLRGIELENCVDVNDHFLNAIASPILEVVKLGEGSHCSDTGFHSFGNTCIALETFQIRGSVGTVWSFDVIMKQCRLRHLELLDNKGVGYSISYNIKNWCMDTLQYLNFSGCEMIDDSCAVVFAVGSLRTLILDFTKIGNVGLKHICKTCTELTNLQVAKCCKLTNEGFLAIPTWAKKIRTLGMAWSFHVTMLTLEEIVQENHAISEIDLRGCIQIRPTNARALAQNARSYIKIILTEGIYIGHGTRHKHQAVLPLSKNVRNATKKKIQKRKSKITCNISVDQGVL